jgi:hypothetical protein
LRILSDKASASCAAEEIMVSAYCAGAAGGAAPAAVLQGMSGASCEGDGVVAVIACAKR